MTERRGQLAVDLIVMCIVMFGIGVVYIYVHSLNTAVLVPMIQQNMTGNQGTAMLTAQEAGFGPLWDNLGIFLFGGIWLFLLISSYYINSSPVFFAIMLIMMVGALIAIMMLGNAFDSLNQNSFFASNAASFPKLSWLMYHILEVTIVVVITCGIALYAKHDTGGIGV